VAGSLKHEPATAGQPAGPNGFSDSSEDEDITNVFLQRRIEEVMRFEKFKAQVRERARAWPGLSEIFNPQPRRPPGRSKAKAG